VAGHMSGENSFGKGGSSFALCEKGSLAGGIGRFHKNIAARPPFWRQTLAPNCQTLEQKSGVFSADSQFSPSLSCAALGFAGLAKKVWRQSLFSPPWRARPSSAHLHAIAARRNPAQSRMAGLRGPYFAVEPRFFAHLSCTRRQSLAQSLELKSEF
jgi:hypothetical protein